VSELSVAFLERLETSQICRGEVAGVTHTGLMVVAFEGDDAPHRCCDVLLTNDAGTPMLAPGDRVLAWVPADDSRAVIIGRIGQSCASTVEVEDPDELPDTLLIEAKESLTLRVGEGSVTIRKDGKILIKGKDLVSHAQRTNRIKGGAVAIN
jgi:hypothetical protein